MRNRFVPRRLYATRQKVCRLDRLLFHAKILARPAARPRSTVASAHSASLLSAFSLPRCVIISLLLLPSCPSVQFFRRNAATPSLIFPSNSLRIIK
jgi:hypothetical protein